MARQPKRQPEGEKISVGPKERAFFTKRRKELGLDQAAFAKKIGWSQSSVSNFEKSIHSQIKKPVYQRMVLLCGEYKATGTQEKLTRSIVNDLIAIDEEGLEALSGFLETLKRTHPAAPKQGGADDTTNVDGNRGGAGKPPRKGS